MVTNKNYGKTNKNTPTEMQSYAILHIKYLSHIVAEGN